MIQSMVISPVIVAEISKHARSRFNGLHLMANQYLVIINTQSTASDPKIFYKSSYRIFARLPSFVSSQNVSHHCLQFYFRLRYHQHSIPLPFTDSPSIFASHRSQRVTVDRLWDSIQPQHNWVFKCLQVSYASVHPSVLMLIRFRQIALWPSVQTALGWSSHSHFIIRRDDFQLLPRCKQKPRT